MKNTLLKTTAILAVLVLALFFYKKDFKNFDNSPPITSPFEEKEEFPKNDDKIVPKITPAPPLEQQMPKNQEIDPQQRKVQPAPKRFRLFHR
jgi:hypothetical protein